MTISLTVDENQHRALHRVMVRPGWSTGDWRELPGLGRQDLGTMANGYWVESYRRRTMPAIGDAWIRYQFGRISGQQYEATQPGETKTGAEDLTNYEIRIQVAAGPTDEQKQTGDGSDSSGKFQPVWRTAWWGTCAYFDDSIQPGASENAGDRRYYCVDGLARKKRRQLDKHGAYVIGNRSFQHGPLEGHPGYNLSRGEGPLLGNRQPFDATGFLRYDDEPSVPGTGSAMPRIDYHTFAGNGDLWTDLQTLVHADLVSRSHGDPVFNVVEDIGSGARSLLESASAWEVRAGQPAWDLMAKITRRQRGRGIAFCDWQDDVGSAAGALTPQLRVRPQTYADAVFKLKDGSTATLSGAQSAGTAVDVDLEGDHRNIAKAFKVSAPNLNRVDFLESLGEFLQVVVTLGVLDGTLGKRWTDAEAAAFSALDPTKRLDSRWTPVYRVYWLEPSWDGHVKDGNNGTSLRADYSCADNGAIVLPDDDTLVITSPLTTHLLKNLPLFEGYNYAVDPAVRYDGQTENGEPERRKPLLLVRTASDRWLDGKDEVGLAGAMGENEVEVSYPGDQGTRLIGDKTVSGLGSSYNAADLAMTVCLELPHRVRYASGDLFPGARRLRIEHPNIHLWLAHPNAIWELNTASRDANGSPPRRDAAGGTTGSGTGNVPGIIRDDRDQLAQLHALAWTWYGQDRRSAKWSLRCCGFLPSFTTDDGGEVPYPTLGQVVHHLQANGETFVIDTPISGIDYDNASETTTWITDWQDLDIVSRS